MGRQNISKWEVASIYSAMSETLEIIKQIPDNEIRNAINGLINHCKKRANELDPKYNKPKSLPAGVIKLEGE